MYVLWIFYGCLCVLPEHVPALTPLQKWRVRLEHATRIAREMVHLQFFQWTMLKVIRKIWERWERSTSNHHMYEKSRFHPDPFQGFTLSLPTCSLSITQQLPAAAHFEGEDHHGMVHGQLFHQYRRRLESQSSHEYQQRLWGPLSSYEGRTRWEVDVEQLCGTAVEQLWDIVTIVFVDGNVVGWKERRWESMDTFIFFRVRTIPKHQPSTSIHIHPHPSSTNFSDCRRLHAGLQLPISQRRRSHGLVLHPWRRGTAGGEDPEHRQGAALGAGETQKGVHRKGRGWGWWGWWKWPSWK